MIGRRSVLILLMNVLGGLLGYVGVIALARLLPNAEEALAVVAFGPGFVGSFFVLTGLGVRAAQELPSSVRRTRAVWRTREQARPFPSFGDQRSSARR